MKELSIEEKARRYDEAIERAKNTIEVNRNIPDIVECVEYLFPALKESEDERIRENIIATIHLYYGEPLEDEAKEMIDWLEKQGEQKPNYCHHEVDLSNCSEEYTKGYYDGWNNCNQQHAQLEAEQKPAEVRTTGYWHVEDTEQNPAWSEEDEKMLDDTICAVGAADYYNYDDKQEIKKWLKSLKERNTWKPSDEQMKVLNECLNFAANHESPHWNIYIFGTLNNLIRQLKKLREK